MSERFKPEDLILLSDCAEKIGVSRQRVYQWVEEGRLRTIEIAGRKYIKKCDCKRPKPIPPGPK